MEFGERVEEFAERAKKIVDAIKNEEATKSSLIMPFFQILGYDIFNPVEFVPEYTADVGIKKGERVDYAVVLDGKPLILIECKPYGENLDQHVSQLFRYYSTTIDAKFAILTDGIIYRFFTDLDRPNILDDRPFLEVDLLNLKDSQIKEVFKFHRAKIDVDNILGYAAELKYRTIIKEWLVKQFNSPTDDLVRLILNDFYDGKKTQWAIDNFRPLIESCIEQFQKDLVNARLKIAIRDTANDDSEADDPELEAAQTDGPRESTIETTLEELEAFAIVKSILHGFCDVNRIAYRDNERYMAVNYDGNNRKRICRFWFNGAQKFITTPDENKEPIRHDIDNINDIFKYAENIIEVCKRYL